MMSVPSGSLYCCMDPTLMPRSGGACLPAEDAMSLHVHKESLHRVSVVNGLRPCSRDAHS